MNVALEEHAVVRGALHVEQIVQILMAGFTARAEKATCCRKAQCAQVGLSLGNGMNIVNDENCFLFKYT